MRCYQYLLSVALRSLRGGEKGKGLNYEKVQFLSGSTLWIFSAIFCKINNTPYVEQIGVGLKSKRAMTS